MSILLDPLFNSMAIGHFFVDMLNSQRAILLTFWSTQQGWSETRLAFLTMLYVWAASLSQPIFGFISDRFGKSRWLATGGIVWISILFTLALTLPIEGAVPCLILASLGSAAFHPVGAMQASLQGRKLYAHREITATSWFFVFGQMSLMIGPIIGGILLSWSGQVSIAILAILGVPVATYVFTQLKKVPSSAQIKESPTPIQQTPALISKTGLVILALIAAFQAWAQQNMITFLPKYLSDLGQSTAVYGLIVGLFMGGSAIGNVIGGNLADRLGRKPVMTLMLLLASLPILMISLLGWSNWLFLLVPLAGILTGSVHSIIVVTAQRSIPSGMALATGLTLGFMFSAGALGTLFCGWLADRSGFPFVFQFTSALVLVAAFFPTFLRFSPPLTPLSMKSKKS